MSEVSRRELIRNAALSLSMGGIGAEAAQHVHQAAADAKKASGGVYKPQCFTMHEFKTIERLADLIIPTDDISKGALEAGAPEFIDLLASHNTELAAIYTGGLAWLDQQSGRRYGSSFIECDSKQQATILALIAYRKNESPELDPGIRFFDWMRKMTVDAFYTSKVGVADIGYKGNVGMTKFEVPVEALSHALRKSGLG